MADYKVNGTGIPLQPTTGRWLPRRLLSVDGNGRARYAPTREFELRWGLKNPGQRWQIQEWFQGIGATGTVVVDLPRYAWSAYEFHPYSGVFIREPEDNVYFFQNYTEVVLLVTNIRTGAV